MNNNEMNWNNHVKDILSRDWKNDLSTLSQTEINSLIQNTFYQLFMIDIEEIEYKAVTNEFGTHVTFNIHGVANRDSETVKTHEIQGYIAEDEDEDDFEE